MRIEVNETAAMVIVREVCEFDRALTHGVEEGYDRISHWTLAGDVLVEIEFLRGDGGFCLSGLPIPEVELVGLFEGAGLEVVGGAGGWRAVEAAE